MAECETLTAEVVRQILDYNSETGVFTWRSRPREHFKMKRIWLTWNARYSGTVAGKISSGGYMQISISGRKYLSHRLAWLWMTGEWPNVHIDHRDTDPSNNRWTNLREVNLSENNRNRCNRSDNTSGHKGIYWNKCNKKWVARIGINGGYRHIGCFDDKNEAAEVIARERLKLHGEFARIP